MIEMNLLRHALFLTVIFILMSPSAMAQQEYQIPEITVEATIQKNGTIEFRETRQFQFQGSFSWADYRLPKAGFDEMQNIRVSENGEYYQLSNSEEPGTYSISDNNDEVIITWHYDAADTTRSFDLSYNLTGAIPHGTEWSELFWTWIGSGRDKHTPFFEVNIRFPEEIESDSLYYWSRTPSDLIQFSHVGSLLTIQALELSRNQSVPVRIVMPVSMFDSDLILEREADLTLERIMTEENELAAKEERKEARRATVAEHAPGLTVVFSILSIALFIFLYQRYSKRYKTLTYSTVSTTMVPSRIEPALVAKLLSNFHTGAMHLSATLFDISRRGWFTLKEQKTEKKWYQSKEETEFIIAETEKMPDESLPVWERMVVDYVKDRLEEGKSKFSELFYGNKDASKMYAKWSKEVDEAFKERNWKDENSLKGVYLNVIFQVIIIILSIILMALGGMIGVVALIVSAVMLAGSAGMIRRTEEGEKVYTQWKAYRDGLKKADERILFRGDLDRHFIYAIAFGLREKELINLIDHGGQHQDGLFFTWLIIAQGSGSTPISAAKNLSKHTATVSASNAGAISGGGASVGAAGGGATGGAG